MIEREVRGGVGVVRLAYGKASALDTGLCRAIAGAIAEVEREGRALVLTGTGGIFCAGVDLRRQLDASADETAEFLRALDDAFEALLRFPGPSVAALNGHAIAGGAVLAAACDHRILAEGKARIGVPELLVGVPFPPAALEILRHALPARELGPAVYSGRTWPAPEALARSFVHELAPPDEVLARAIERAEALHAIPRETFRVTKEQMLRPVLRRIEESRGQHEEHILARWQDDETREAMRRYVEATLGRRRQEGR